ncbi:unnamed protein product, partial [Heterotrigona itama]
MKRCNKCNNKLITKRRKCVENVTEEERRLRKKCDVGLCMKFLVCARTEFNTESSWRTWMGADSSDSVVSIGWHRGCGHGDASSLSEV